MVVAGAHAEAVVVTTVRDRERKPTPEPHCADAASPNASTIPNARNRGAIRRMGNPQSGTGESGFVRLSPDQARVVGFVREREVERVAENGVATGD